MRTGRLFFAILFFLFTCYYTSWAQKQNNIWYFGDSAGLSFNSGAPLPLTNGALSTSEGSASIADTGGNVLFYTDGITIWNKNNTPMLNGTGLSGNSSSTQSALIVQQPDSANLYYVFVTWGSLTYSIVDMTLNGGLGDVVAGAKNILLEADAGEKICGTPSANGKDVWVMSHEYTTNGFNAFLLTSTGIDTTPVHTNSGMANDLNGAYGQMKFTCQGDKIAYGVSDQTSGMNYTICVSSFDNNTGVVSNSYYIQTATEQTYGIEFSPAGQYLYASIGDVLTQYNLNAGSPSQVQTSATEVGNTPGYAMDGLQIGPDRKIYVDMNSSKFVSVVNDPDIGGVACNFSESSVSLGGKTIDLDFPSMVNFQCSPQYLLTVSDTETNSTCYGQCNGTATARISMGTPPYHILWTPGNFTGAAITHLCAGSYILNVTDQFGSSFTDTLLISNPKPPVVDINAPDTAFCRGDSIRLAATPGFVSYTWSTPLTDSVIEIGQPGNYYVHVTDTNGCTGVSDTVTITTTTPPFDTITANQLIFCSADSAQLCAISGFTAYLWTTGDTTPCITTKQPGHYSAIVTDSKGCTAVSDTLSINVYRVPVDTISTSKNIFCPDDSTQICAPSGFFTYYWNTGDTSTCIYAKEAGNYYMTVTDLNGCTAESNTISLSVYSPHQASISQVGDTLSSFGASSYQWLQNGNIISGATDSVYVAHQPGSYSVQVTDTNECAATSQSVLVTGISNLSAEENISIYPNPNAVGNWQLTVGNELVGSALEVFDEQGRLVMKSEVRSQKSDLTADKLPSGVYYLRISNDNMSVVRKLVKM